MSPVRVLLLGPVSSADGGRTTGGIATHVSDLARALAASGHEVAVFADNLPAAKPARATWGTLFTRAAGKTPSLVASNAGLALRINADGVASELGQGLGTTLSYVAGLASAVSAHRPDVIHIHQADWRSLYTRLARVVDVPVVVTQHSLSVFHDETGCLLTETAMARATLDGLKAARALIAVSDDVARGLADIDPALSALVVPNGIDLERFAPSPGDRAASPTIAFVGRVSRDKGAADLIAAAGLVAKGMPELRVVLAGPVEDVDPAAEARAAGLPADAVETPGALSETEVAALLRRSWALALPSHLREGQPRALLEAMASGVPVVATRVGSVPDLLAEGELGELVERGDVLGLAGALERTLRGGAQVDARVSAARERVAGFDLGAVAGRIAAVYRDVIAAREA